MCKFKCKCIQIYKGRGDYDNSIFVLLFLFLDILAEFLCQQACLAVTLLVRKKHRLMSIRNSINAAPLLNFTMEGNSESCGKIATIRHQRQTPKRVQAQSFPIALIVFTKANLSVPFSFTFSFADYTYCVPVLCFEPSKFLHAFCHIPLDIIL